ncbi:GNAT family N-acetyltransferase [Tissierella pigra]|uniref:GNAT family N-acetyltransferase n=1 Tax=Tissierella pigra TaxID=2607614 RepID=A0A6N7XG02_9FIRM|nr:GNAT family N-acetyltransferase [Tissierella pigra]MBU5427426.1 GNAT family N-acetyltransferase [Tissierella pigra]MSU00971.1 GNAT family N-acetyltransferase [Tissierella pigra]
MLIRKLYDEELYKAVDLLIECWNDDYRGVVLTNTIDREEKLKYLTSWINEKYDDIRRIYGAFDGEKFAGFVGASIAEREDSDDGVELSYLFVKREYRRRGLGIKLIKSIVDEFKVYGFRELIVYNWHEVSSNKYYLYLGGKVKKQVVQSPKGKDTLVDVFVWNLADIIKTLNDMLYARDVQHGGLHVKKKLDESIIITTDCSNDDYDCVCKGLFKHNVMKTEGVLRKPGIDINLYLKTSDEETIGAILCDTFNYCMYIDVMWINEKYRGKGYGRILITEAERMAREYGCIFAHTCTFSYQSPWFYKRCGYEVFSILDDYPDGIKQYFLKKRF